MRPINSDPQCLNRPQSSSHPSFTPFRLSYLNVVYCATNILNIFHLQHPIDHRCISRLCQKNRNKPLPESIRCRDRTRKFSRGYPGTAPRTRERIQGLSGRKSETNQLSHPGRECHSCLLWHSRRGGQSRKSNTPSHDSFNVSSSGPIPTSKGIVCWNRCPPLCSSLDTLLIQFLVISEFARPPVGSRQVTMLSSTFLSAWEISSSVSRSIRQSRLLRL